MTMRTKNTTTLSFCLGYQEAQHSIQSPISVTFTQGTSQFISPISLIHFQFLNFILYTWVLLYPTFNFILLKLGVVEIKNKSKRSNLTFPMIPVHRALSVRCQRGESNRLGSHGKQEGRNDQTLDIFHDFTLYNFFLFYPFRRTSSSGTNDLNLSLVFSFSKYSLPTLPVSYWALWVDK